MNEVLRQEKKFLITLDQYYLYSAQFARIMAMDSHSHGEGYEIRSLYFDTPEDNDFQEKEDGVEVRRKIRLRTYGPDTPFAMLEMKQKQGPLQKKRSLRVSRETAAALCRGDYSPLLTYDDPFAAECFAVMHLHGYRPKSIVEYKRKAFVAKENKIRVTFDHHITATEACMDLFAPDLNLNPVLDPYHVILEVKYNGFLTSSVKDMLDLIQTSELSAGKYSMSRGLSKHYRF